MRGNRKFAWVHGAIRSHARKLCVKGVHYAVMAAIAITGVVAWHMYPEPVTSYDFTEFVMTDVVSLCWQRLVCMVMFKTNDATANKLVSSSVIPCPSVLQKAPSFIILYWIG